MEGSDRVYYLLSFISSILIALMILVNGKLGSVYGSYFSVIIIHIVGITLLSAILAFKKYSVRIKEKTPWYFYTGGFIGYFTVIFNVLSFGKISLSAIIALCLFGQMVTSIVVDNFGLMGMKKIPINIYKSIGTIVTMIGVIIMINGSEFHLLAIIMSFLSGVTIVISRTVNAELSERSNEYVSGWYNYFTGIITAVVAFIILSESSLIHVEYINIMRSHLTISNIVLYTGGILGVGIVVLANVCVRKISAINMTLILFAGQIFAGIIIDYALSDIIVIQNVLGGLCAVVGLLINCSENTSFKSKFSFKKAATNK